MSSGTWLAIGWAVGVVSVLLVLHLFRSTTEPQEEDDGPLEPNAAAPHG